MIDQARINELRRIYGGSNNEAYRTVNQLLDEIERLHAESVVTELLSTVVEDEIASISQLSDPIEEVTIEQPTEDIQLTELTEEIAQRTIEPKESNDDSKPTKANRKSRKTASKDDGTKADSDG